MLEGLVYRTGNSEFLPHLNNVEFEFDTGEDVMVDGAIVGGLGVEITDQENVLN